MGGSCSWRFEQRCICIYKDHYLFVHKLKLLLLCKNAYFCIFYKGDGGWKCCLFSCWLLKNISQEIFHLLWGIESQRAHAEGSLELECGPLMIMEVTFWKLLPYLIDPMFFRRLGFCFWWPYKVWSRTFLRSIWHCLHTSALRFL